MEENIPVEFTQPEWKTIAYEMYIVSSFCQFDTQLGCYCPTTSISRITGHSYVHIIFSLSILEFPDLKINQNRYRYKSDLSINFLFQVLKKFHRIIYPYAVFYIIWFP